MKHTPVRNTLRAALAALLLVPVAACGTENPGGSSPSPEASSSAPVKRPYDASFKKLEQKYDARLGVYALDTGSGREVAYRADERFGYHSTFKALAAGAVLRERGLDGLDAKRTYGKEDLVLNSPVTEKHVGTGMSLRDLCDAAVRYSDNTAANVLFDELGGPKALDSVLEELGDDTTRMERREPHLSTWTPGERRDTSTPRALTKDLRAFVLGDALEKPEREQLTKWLRTNTTGDETIRAGVPKGWKVGDKTGAGQYFGARNDIAVVWPPGRAPLVLAVLSNRFEKDAEYDNALIADAAAEAVKSLEK